MRMQFRERIDFTYVVPKRPQGEKGKITDQLYPKGHVITTYARLAYPASSSISVQRSDIDERTSAVYRIYYTKELEHILLRPQSWKVRLYQNEKLKNKLHTLLRADLDLRTKQLEIQI